MFQGLLLLGLAFLSEAEPWIVRKVKILALTVSKVKLHVLVLKLLKTVKNLFLSIVTVKLLDSNSKKGEAIINTMYNR